MLLAFIAGRNRRAGQITVELLLILPVFLLIVFMIMELGNLAFWTIIVNHMAYEGARIGSMWAGADQPRQAPKFDTGRATQKIQDQLRKALPRAVVGVKLDPNSYKDPQDGQEARDLIVTVRQPVQLIFPMTPWVLRLSPACRGNSGQCIISASVRMPVENPQRYSGL